MGTGTVYRSGVVNSESARARPSGADPLRERFERVREGTVRLTAPLAVEDFVAQSMPETDPVNWHLGHTSWFFEKEILTPLGITVPGTRPEYREIFEAGSKGTPAAERGRRSRPTVAEVFDYRRSVDRTMLGALDRGLHPEPRALTLLGTHHEQIHQERLLADLKHLFRKNPGQPAYRRETVPEPPSEPGGTVPLRFVAFPGGKLRFGHRGDGFAFVNETPRHPRRIPPFRLASRLATNGEYLEFIEEGGYRDASLWLPAGRRMLREEGLEAPLYWQRSGDRWLEFTLGGLMPLDPAAPVIHVSFHEAAAFARWRGARLPTEFEWESAAADRPREGCFLERERLRPEPAAPKDAGPAGPGPAQLFGSAWEWTASADLPYPRHEPGSGPAAALGGSFFAGRIVVRGGSCLTPESHLRASYRRFLRPGTRWQTVGIRLARDS